MDPERRSLALKSCSEWGALTPPAPSPRTMISGASLDFEVVGGGGAFRTGSVTRMAFVKLDPPLKTSITFLPVCNDHPAVRNIHFKFVPGCCALKKSFKVPYDVFVRRADSKLILIINTVSSRFKL